MAEKDILEGFEEVSEAAKGAFDVLMETASSAKSAAEAFNLLRGGLTETLGVTEQQVESMGAAGAAIGGYTAQLALGTIEQNAYAAGLARTTLNQLKVSEAFNQATGFAGQYNKQIQDAVFRNREFGLSSEDSAMVVSDLAKTFTDFTIDGISPTENALIDAATALKAVGIDSKQSTEAFQILRKAFGQTDAEIVRTTLGLENFAEELGVASSELFETFTSQMPVLAMFGSEAERVFRQTAAAAKSSGLEFKTIMGLFDATDTFQGSAEAAGQLNALLGGPFLNTIELTMAETPVERMQMLSQAFQDAGVSADSMSRRQQQAFISAIDGIENSADLTKLLAGDFMSLTDAVDASAKSQAELSDEASKTRGFKENLEVAQDVAMAVDGIAQSLDVVNQQGFTPMIDSLENMREAIKSSVGEPLMSIVESFKSEMEAIGISEENLAGIKEEAISAREQRQRQPAELTGGQQIPRIQLFIDGNEVRNLIALSKN